MKVTRMILRSFEPVVNRSFCPPELRDAMETLRSTVYNRKFFLTNGGRMGTGVGTIEGEDGVRVGDEIHVIMGSRISIYPPPVGRDSVNDAPEDAQSVPYTVL